MFLFAGLGNPDAKYQGNRHNIGFQIISALAEHYALPPARSKFRGLISEGQISGHGFQEKALLLQPMTYYNESGKSVSEAVNFYKIPLDQVVVFHDELDLAPGKIKIKQGGSTAGNNGLKSITSHIGADFLRVRIGIGHPGDKSRVTSHVLSDFSSSEWSDWVNDLIDAIARELPLLFSGENGKDRFLSAVAQRAPGRQPTRAEDQRNASPPKRSPSPPQAASDTKKENDSPFAKLKGLFRKEN